MTDFFTWRANKASRAKKKPPRDPYPDRPQREPESQGLEVTEFDGASTTVIRKIRAWWAQKP